MSETHYYERSAKDPYKTKLQFLILLLKGNNIFLFHLYSPVFPLYSFYVQCKRDLSYSSHWKYSSSQSSNDSEASLGAEESKKY
jgi:hypothetical protein